MGAAIGDCPYIPQLEVLTRLPPQCLQDLLSFKGLFPLLLTVLLELNIATGYRRRPEGKLAGSRYLFADTWFWIPRKGTIVKSCYADLAYCEDVCSQLQLLMN